MISENLIQEVSHFVYNDLRKYQVLPESQFTVAIDKGEWLAVKFEANVNIVRLGTLLMDSMLSLAVKKNIPGEHIKMSEDKAKEILSKFPEVNEEERQNILHCVKEHHGVDDFYSLESEICCNADCYKFISIKGVAEGMHEKNMPLSDLVSLYKQKADEKWGALSLDICKEELEQQYKVIKEFFSYYPLEK